MKPQATVKTENILRQVERLWAGFGQDAENGVLRACSMTLIVATCPETPEENTTATLASLMKEHPSRGIVLRLRDGEEPEIEASVRAQCWTPFGRSRQICCEHIEISSTQAGIDDLIPVLRGLLAPDLPVVLWVRTSEPGIEALYGLAGKLIFDTGAAPDAAEALERLEAASQGGRLVGDLNWSRLTQWRQAVAQMFESAAQRAKLDRIERVTVGYKTERPPVRAYYLASWFRRALDRPVEFQFLREDEARAGTIQSVAVTGPDLRCSVARAGLGEAITMRMDQLTIPGVFPSLGDYDLMREELSIPGRDLVYDEVRRLALELSRRE